MTEQALAGFDTTTFTDDGKTRDVFRLGTGPAVLVIAEIPGITPKVLSFARQVAELGCTVVLPHLYGTPGRDPGGAASALPYALSSMVPACVSREFSVLATGRTSPVTVWLRALARAEHARCAGPGVGVVGMCFTGGFALAMAVDDIVLAPVLAEPSLPFSVSASRRRSIDTSPADLDIVKGRCAAGLQVLGLRFAGDKLCPPERFAFLREQLGEAFVGVELPDSSANPDAVASPHSVLTEHLVDEPGTPTRQALDQVLELFRSRLLTGPDLT